MIAAGYIQRHVLDVLTIVALKILSNYVNHIAHTPLIPNSRRKPGAPNPPQLPR